MAIFIKFLTLGLQIVQSRSCLYFIYFRAQSRYYLHSWSPRVNSNPVSGVGLVKHLVGRSSMGRGARSMAPAAVSRHDYLDPPKFVR